MSDPLVPGLGTPSSEEPIEYLILNGVEALMKTIKPANGFWSDVKDDSVLRKHLNVDYDSPCQDPDHYPYVVVNTGSYTSSPLVSYQTEGVMTFPIVCHAYSETEVDRDLSRLVKDVERALASENISGCPLISSMVSPASGSVQSIFGVTTTTDENFLAPWGLAIVRVEVKYRTYLHLQRPNP